MVAGVCRCVWCWVLMCVMTGVCRCVLWLVGAGECVMVCAGVCDGWWVQAHVLAGVCRFVRR
jgi:hypothetical protein